MRHLVGNRLRPSRVALDFRLLARNLAIGALGAAEARPAPPTSTVLAPFACWRGPS